MTTPDPYSPQGQYPPPAYGPGAYGPPPGAPSPYGRTGQPETEVKAMIALGLAIAAYTPTIPFIGAIAAIVLARMARNDILASGGAKTGLNLCTWAVVLSVVHLVLVSLLLLLFFGLFLLPFSLAL